MRNMFFTDESVKRQITDSISENLTDSDLESRETHLLIIEIYWSTVKFAVKPVNLPNDIIYN